MDYINSLIQKWMPSNTRVAVNSSPKLHGIFDSVNTSLAANNPEIRLAREFYDIRARKIMDRILMEEEYSGYHKNLEYRRLGIGPILGEVIQRLSASSCRQDLPEMSTQGTASPCLLLYACHDSTIAATLASLDSTSQQNEINSWPPYTSSLAIELFRDRETTGTSGTDTPGHYVRVRYNDRPVKLAGCVNTAHHLQGKADFCTLVSRTQTNYIVEY